MPATHQSCRVVQVGRQLAVFQCQSNKLYPAESTTRNILRSSSSLASILRAIEHHRATSLLARLQAIAHHCITSCPA